MSTELVVLLRHRVATRYYDRPQVIDTLARRLGRDLAREDQGQS